ncbi:MAG: TetR/AcrR family transcriptional regulator, partial [Fimbriimonadaceae bacterium]|nr:TetR/AcrR family transcriptional regulator [Alphaproteobacteria bacterium]
MAKEPKRAAKPKTRKTAPRKTPKQKIVDAAFKLAKDHDWSDIKLSQIARQAKVPLAELTHLFSSKTDIIVAHISQIDDRVLSSLDPEMENEPARERLLDVMISRIEALAATKEALYRIKNTLPRDPVIMGKLNQALVASMTRMLIAA